MTKLIIAAIIAAATSAAYVAPAQAITCRTTCYNGQACSTTCN
jgi:hypothetical protein